MRTLLICLFLVSGCTESASDTPRSSSFFGGSEKEEFEPLSKTMRTGGGEEIKLEDGAELILAEGTFISPVDVTFSRSTCGGIFAGTSFKSCAYTVDFESAPKERFEIRLPGVGVLNGEENGEFKPIGVINNGTALKTRRFALRTDDDGSCADVEFSGCGGDLSGEWELTYACGSVEEVTGFSFSSLSEVYAACDENDWLREYPFKTRIKLNFGDGGQYERLGSVQIKKREVVTQTCLDIVGESCHNDCVLADGVCNCLFDKVSGGGSASGSNWAYSDTELKSFILDGPNAEEGGESGPGLEHEYCVEGDRLSIRAKENPAIFVYQKK